MTGERKRGRRRRRQHVLPGEHYTSRSVTMTDAMWDELEEYARARHMTRAAVIRLLVDAALVNVRSLDREDS